MITIPEDKLELIKEQAGSENLTVSQYLTRVGIGLATVSTMQINRPTLKSEDNK